MICNKCGCKVDKDVKFCVRCGADLRQEGAAIQEPRREKAPLPEESKDIVRAFVLALIGVILAFVVNNNHEWYVTLIFLLFKAAGLVLSGLALILTLKAPRPRRGLTLAALILAIVGMVICGIALIGGMFEMINEILNPYPTTIYF